MGLNVSYQLFLHENFMIVLQKQNAIELKCNFHLLHRYNIDLLKLTCRGKCQNMKSIPREYLFI